MLPATPGTPCTENNPVQEPVVSEKPADLVWYLVGPQQEPETEKITQAANTYLKDKLNVEVNLTVLGYGDPYNNKVNTMLAAGERIR